MTIYLDIGVVRIQEYINRTAGADGEVLRKRRGASRMVAQATDPDELAKGLLKQYEHWTIERNDETYSAEGVAHLRALPQGNAPSSADAQQLAAAAAQLVREQVPMAYLEASWAVADSYHAALPLLRQARAGSHTDTHGSLTSIPAFRDVAETQRCSSCGGLASEGAGTCFDCTGRESKGSDSQSKSSPSPQDWVIDQFETKHSFKVSPPEDLGSLAELARSTRLKSNHLATVYADGNNVGSLFKGLSDLNTAKSVSTALDTATRQAGVEALLGLMAQDTAKQTVLPGVVTTLAADDVLITVPAAFGWRFVLKLVRAFNEWIGNSLGDDITSQKPSLTAGIVFHHVKSPMENAIQEADHTMRKAKQDASGAHSQIGWKDLTAEQAAISRPFEWFKKHDVALRSLARMPRAQASRLARILQVPLADAAVDDSAVAKFLQEERRRLNADEESDGVLLLLNGAGSSAALDDLRTALSFVRWFETEETEGP